MSKKSIEPYILKYMENVNEFKVELGDISKKWEQLILLSQLGSTGIDLSSTTTDFNNLTQNLITKLASQTLDKVINEMVSKAQVSVDIVIRNLFERTADIGFLATDDDIREFIQTNKQLKSKLLEHKDDEDDTTFRTIKMSYKKDIETLKNRFQEYVANYSVYDDIVLFNTKGEIITRLTSNTSITKTNEKILDLTNTTSDGFVETYQHHDFLPSQDKSLVYTYKITKSNTNEKIIGYLSLCFKFEDEMKSIYSKLINKQNKETILLLDSNGIAISSSDKYHIPINSTHDINTSSAYNITQFAGRDYIVKTSQTNGYEGFYGLGWLGHIMIPLDSAFSEAFSKDDMKIDDNILYSIMQNENIFEKELLLIPQKANTIQGQLDRAVWNGNTSSNKDTTHNEDFSKSILKEVGITGEHTKLSFNVAIEKLNHTIITSLLDNAQFTASLSIDIMDRNLYERANDVRWWALTSTFRELLSMNESADTNKLTNILTYINELYTVYTNLFIYDKNGKILAVSNKNEQHLIGTPLPHSWVEETLNLNNSSNYIVSDFENTSLYNSEATYIYNATIKNIQNTNTVGGIGIVFDSKPQFKDILNDAIAPLKQKINANCFSLFVDKKNKEIISCSDNSHNIGATLDIDLSMFNIVNGESKANVLEYNNKYYIISASCSNGYREYKNENDNYVNDVLAFVFIEAGIPENINEDDNIAMHRDYKFEIQNNEETNEIATFYIGNKWLGVKTEDVLEAVSIETLSSSISMEKDHHFKGTVIYKDTAVSILDISRFIKDNNNTNKTEIIIINYKGAQADHAIGIIANKLGEIIKVPVSHISPFNEQLIGGGMLSQSIIRPPKDTKNTDLITLLDIKKLFELNEL